MTKIIKYVCMAFVALLLISKAIDLFEDIKRENSRSERTSYNPSKTIGGQMVQNIIDDATDEILPGEDAEPIIGEVYSDADGDECIFSESPKGGLRVSLNMDGEHVFDMEQIGTGAYDTFYPGKHINTGYIIRMLDGGRAIEVQKGKGVRKVKTIFKTPSSTFEE